MNDCTCAKCISGCKRNPGWFLPGEAEKAAALLGMPFDEFFKTYLVIDFWCGLDEYDIYAPLKILNRINAPPRTVEILRDLEDRNRALPGQRVTWGYGMLEGRCIFLDENDRCKIHAAKPFECSECSCDPMYKEKWPGNRLRHFIAKKWVHFYKTTGDLP